MDPVWGSQEHIGVGFKPDPAHPGGGGGISAARHTSKRHWGGLCLRGAVERPNGQMSLWGVGRSAHVGIAEATATAAEGSGAGQWGALGAQHMVFLRVRGSRTSH